MHFQGTLVGLTLKHGREHVARAVLEGIALQIKDVADAMVQDSGVLLTTMRVDGGVSQSDILLQAQVKTKTGTASGLLAAFLPVLACLPSCPAVCT